MMKLKIEERLSVRLKYSKPGSVVSWAISKVQRVKIIMTGYLILQPFILKWPRKFVRGRFGRVYRTLILRWELGLVFAQNAVTTQALKVKK